MVTQWAKVIIVLVVLVVLASAAGGAVAQDNRAPDLVIFYGDDVWTVVDGVPQPHPFCCTGYSDERRWSPLIVSLDGAHLAYLTMPEHEGFSGPAPTNVRLCHGVERVDMLIGPQPDDVSLEPGAAKSVFNAQSQPVWSPDSRYLAWTVWQVRPGGSVMALVLYDVAAGETRTIIQGIPEQSGIVTPLDVAWTQAGIWVHSLSYEPDTSLHVLLLFDAGGALIDQFSTPPDVDRIDDFFGAADALVVMDSDDRFHLLNPVTGEWRALEGTLQLYVPGAPPDSLAVQYRIEDNDAVWEIVTPDGAVTPLDHHDLRTVHSLALAPDGQAVAYGTVQVSLWRDGTIATLPIPNTGGVTPDISIAWAAPAWRVVLE